MKVSLNWAQYYSNVDLRAVGQDELLKKIGAQLGAIEEVEDWGIRFNGITIVKVVNCEKHTDSDKLSLCTIDDGGKVKDVDRDASGHVQVVCGALNVHADMLAVWIPPGSVVPSTLGEEPLSIESREIRGKTSHGMLASAAELGISEDHSGILEVNLADTKEDTGPGTAFAEAYMQDGDVVIDIENKMFTHRPDCFGILGVARELAGIQGLAFKSPEWYWKYPIFQVVDDAAVSVKVASAELVPRFMAVAMKDVQVGSSPVWMQLNLAAVGIRPINNIVDITNYIMYLTGQPLHAYDLDKLLKVSGSSSPKLEARLSRKGEKVTLLGGKQLELIDTSTILITSNDVPVGIGGVMGGADTEVDSSTKNIVIECANFDMYSIRRTAMKYGLFTEAVTRFNKGQSPEQTDRALFYAMKLVTEHAHGKQASSVVDERKFELGKENTIKANVSFINDRLGSNLSAKDMAKLLQNVEFAVLEKGDELEITAPFWRQDIAIPEDIVEEVGRLHGYDNLPLQLPRRSIQPSITNPLRALQSGIRDSLSAGGANEILTYTFVHVDVMEKVGQDANKAYRLANAISPELQFYRLSLLPSLLEKVHPNIKQGFSEFALFELNPVHTKLRLDADKLPIEDQHLALIFAADDKTAKAKYDGAPFYMAKQYLTQLLKHLGAHQLQFEALESQKLDKEHEQVVKPFEAKRTAVVRTHDGKAIGFVGELRTKVRRALKLPDFTAGFEIDIEPLLALQKQTRHYQSLSRFPRVDQDITLKVDATLPVEELFAFLESDIRRLQKERPDKTRVSLDVTDIYQRDEYAKQVTARFSMTSYERTLRTDEVSSFVNNIAEAAKDKFGAERI